jgi:hypothetical protein
VTKVGQQHLVFNGGEYPTHIGENKVHKCDYCGDSFYKGFRLHEEQCKLDWILK